MRKTYRYRLYPTTSQATALEAQVGEACRLYNAALQEWRDAYQRCGVSLNSYDQANQLKAMRAGGMLAKSDGGAAWSCCRSASR
jgi:putative transposase